MTTNPTHPKKKASNAAAETSAGDRAVVVAKRKPKLSQRLPAMQDTHAQPVQFSRYPPLQSPPWMPGPCFMFAPVYPPPFPYSADEEADEGNDTDAPEENTQSVHQEVLEGLVREIVREEAVRLFALAKQTQYHHHSHLLDTISHDSTDTCWPPTLFADLLASYIADLTAHLARVALRRHLVHHARHDALAGIVDTWVRAIVHTLACAQLGAPPPAAVAAPPPPTALHPVSCALHIDTLVTMHAQRSGVLEALLIDTLVGWMP